MQTTGVAIPGQYIVVMKNDSASASSVDAIASEHPGEVQHRYSAALNGLSLSLNDAGLGKMLADPRVAYVEEDEAVTLSTVQTGAAWGLDRIDQKKLPLSTTYSYAMDGSGVTVYIIDTGINFFHTEYAGRAFTGVDEITPGGTAIDCLGHGTSVAGVVGGTTYGVAKKVKMVSVRVYDCKGAGAKSQLIAGVDWVTAHRVRPAVANMSLISSPSAALNQAVLNSMAAGVTYVVAAGNGTQDACISSPAQVAGVIAVGATTNTDGFANFSNFGKCVSINAPGANIPTSALASSNSATTVASGTSLSSPSVAGAAALYLQQNPGASPAQVLAALKSNATANVITNLSAGTPNLLLYTGFIVGVTTPPVANYTSSCPALACSFDASTSTALASATYAWTFGDGATATGKTSSHTYAAAGAYSVVLTVTDANGTGTKTTTVNPGATSGLPVARFTIACPGMQCAVDASTSSSNGGIVRYAWAWGDGRTEAHPFATTKSTWATTGTYAVTLTVTDAAGRTNSVTKQVPVPNKPPVAAITSPAVGASFVQGSPVSFAGTGTDVEDGALAGASLAWTSSRDGAIGTGVSFSTSTLSVGTHTITLTVHDALGATGIITSSVTVTAAPVNTPPVPRFTFTCAGLAPHQCAFDGTGSTGSSALTSYAWTWGDGKSEAHPTGATRKTYPSSGTFNVMLTVTDAKGLTASLTQAVAVP